MMKSGLIATFVASALGADVKAFTSANTKKCNEAVKATGTTADTVFTQVGHGLADGNYVYYEANGGYSAGGLVDKTVYKITGRTADTFKLLGTIKDSMADATTGVRLAAWSSVDAIKMNKGTFRKVLAKACIAHTDTAAGTMFSDASGSRRQLEASDASRQLGASNNRFIKFTQQANAVCAVNRDTLHLVFKYNGVKADGTAVDASVSTIAAGASGLAADTSYTCFQSGGNTGFALMATTSTAVDSHNKGTNTAGTGTLAPFLSGTTVAHAFTGTGSVCLLKLSADADTSVKSKFCLDASPSDNASCAHVNGSAADKKQFWVTSKCDVGSDANCKAMDTKLPKWDKKNNKCVKATTSTSSKTRVLASAVVALFGLMA